MAEKRKFQAPSLEILENLVSLNEQLVSFVHVYGETNQELGDDVADDVFEEALQQRLSVRVKEIKAQFDRCDESGFPLDELLEQAKVYLPPHANVPVDDTRNTHRSQAAYKLICQRINSMCETYKEFAIDMRDVFASLDAGGYLDTEVFEISHEALKEVLIAMADIARDYPDMFSHHDYALMERAFGVDLDTQSPARSIDP